MGCIQTHIGETAGILLLGGMKEGNAKSKELWFFDPTTGKVVAKPSGLEMPKEDDHRYSPPVVRRGANKIYAVCQTQLYALYVEKAQWLRVEEGGQRP